MSTKNQRYVEGFSSGATYEAPKVSEETLDAGGNYVSSASKSASVGTLGTSVVK